MRLISCAVKHSDRPGTENGKNEEKKMCYFPISSVSVPIVGLKTLLWWGSGGRKRVCIITQIKKKRREREMGTKEKGVNYNQANLM